ncbi:MAG: peptidase M23 [Rhodovulum sulfidophilum]|uniref:Peptidase M23 n=1 Tax=Rhodovulum sulfidophilum TaxID=35806 RepID=A0A2W5NCV2_RHOSU|nr:MAG: peptidase M23 [Rhodovulum sulfidophilum]
MTARRALRIWPALGLALLGAVPAGASPAEDMAEAAARIDAAGQELAAATKAESRVRALTAAIGAYQSALDVLRAGVGGANARERELSLALEERRDEIQHLIAALETLARTPPPAQGGLHPSGPVAAARAASVLSRLTPAMQAEAEDLKARYAELEELRRLRVEGERDLASGIAALGAARTELGHALDERAPPQPRETEDPAMAAMLRDSDTLTTLAAKLAAQGGGAVPAPDAPPPRLVRPVAGEIVRGFDMPDAAGVKRPGVTMRAAALSLVTAPADAIVRYVGPFLDYGYVVVVETDDGTLVVLAGLAQVQVRLGQAVRRGDLLGQLGGPAYEGGRPGAAPEAAPETAGIDGAPEDEAAGDTGALETLYIEVRHGQGPVDPAQLFVSENG